jgi:hypothetical protein
MGRWSRLDSDEERLPEGITRIAYDADTQVYTYRDADGSLWKSAPGQRYGRLSRVGSPTPLRTLKTANEVKREKPACVLHDAADENEHAEKGKSSTSPVPKKTQKAHLKKLGLMSKTTRIFLPNVLPLSKGVVAGQEGDT